MSSSEDIELKNNNNNNGDYCGCCEGILKSTPAKIENLPGLLTLAYRVGKYKQFKDSMFVSLSSHTDLSKLTTRDESSDLAIACLDSCALLLDVLTFYQERIANEGFLRTATERHSLLELARTIGYELRPGVAANTFLAFTVEDATVGAAEKTTATSTTAVIDIGTKVQSMPESSKMPTPQAFEKITIDKIQSQMPQIFETTEKIEAKPQWNKLKPKLTKKQTVDEYSSVIYFKGVGTQLRSGDLILIVNKEDSNSQLNTFYRVVSKLTSEPEKQRTRVDMLEAKQRPLDENIMAINGIEGDSAAPNVSALIDFSKPSIDLTELDENQKTIFASTKWSMSEYTTIASKSGLNNQEFFGVLNNWVNEIIAASAQTTWVYSFRVKAGVFGNNAPSYDILPDTVKSAYQNWDASSPQPLAINMKRVANNKIKNYELTSDPEAIITQTNGNIHIFIRGGNSALLHRQFDGTSWNKWGSPKEGLSLTTGPAAVAWSSGGKITVFARGTDNALWHLDFDGASWQDWSNLGGQLASDPAAVFSDWGGGRIDVFVKGADGTLLHKWYNNAEGWGDSPSSHWETIGGGDINSGPAAVVWPSGRLFVFALTSDRRLQYGDFLLSDMFESGIDPNSPWNTIFGDDELYSDPSAVSWGENSLFVYCRGKGNKIYSTFYEGESFFGGALFSEWGILDAEVSSGLSAISSGTDKIQIFFIDANGSLSYKWYDKTNGDWGLSPDDHLETLDAGLPIPTFEDIYYKNDGKLIYLDNAYSTIVPISESNASWLVLESPLDSQNDSRLLACKISDTREETMVDFTLSTKVTGLTLDIDKGSELSDFAIRKTSVYAQSEELALAEMPIEEPIKGNSIVLDRAIVLSNRQFVAISGKIVDEKKHDIDLFRSEIAIISEVGLDVNACTKITFEHSLQNSYKRESIILNANVARANHGQTKEVVLGGGDPSRYLQRFMLREKPLTYISDASASGAKSTLEIRINDIKWNEAPSLYNLGPKDRSYITRMDNESQTHIIFGDGIRGLRPEAGLDNIKANYRIGIGKEGILIKAGQLSILMDRPLGITSVTNPLAPTDAADPENEEDARHNAPLPVVAMDRVVSLTDYENFAMAFAGIGKAHAIWIWDGEKRIIYLTIASETGKAVQPSSELYQNLVKAIDNYKDPVTRFKIGAPILKMFNVRAGILVSDGFEFKDVKLEVEEALENKFSFEAREFGQHVTISEVISVIQNVEGVNATDIDYLYLTEEKAKPMKLISSKTAHWNELEKKVMSAELLTLNSVLGGGGITITEMKSAK